MKAKKFKIGDALMHLYILPDGRKRLSGHDITSAIGEDGQSLCQFWEVKSLKQLPRWDSDVPEIMDDSGKTFTPVAIEDAVIYWHGMAYLGNEKASELMCFLDNESIELRIEALGINPKSKTKR